MMDQFLRPAKSQSKWFGLYSDHKADLSAVTQIHVNSIVSTVGLQDSLASLLPHLLHNVFHRKHMGETTRQATVICNQAASFNRCFFKVQQNMQEQLKTVCTESKGKSSSTVSTPMDELQYLMNFNSSITQAAAKTMEHLTEFIFISMRNLTLACRDGFLTH